jgi:hypothetical protein
MTEPETEAQRRIRELRAQRSLIEQQMTMSQWTNRLAVLNDECCRIDEEITALGGDPRART